MAIHHSSHERTPKKKALLIGINYKKLNKDYKKGRLSQEPSGVLEAAHRNARHVKKLLSEKLGFAEDDIVMMLDKSNFGDLVPTQDNIRREIAHLVEGAMEGDHLFFSYSGHGEQREASEDEEEEDGKDEAIVGCDNKIILDNELKKILPEPLPFGSHLMVLWDTCHSGTMLDLPYNTLPKFMYDHAVDRHHSETPPGYSHRTVVSRAASLGGSLGPQGSSTEEHASPDAESIAGSTGGFHQPAFLHRATVISISACRDDQSAWEGPGGASFSEFFVQAMTMNPHQPLRELLMDLHEHVKHLTADRHSAFLARGHGNLSHHDSDTDSDKNQGEGQSQDQDQDQDQEEQDIQVSGFGPLDNEYEESVEELI